jgi:hypothetical protein
MSKTNYCGAFGLKVPNRRINFCCKKHDYDYGLGGHCRSRLEADHRFFRCLKEHRNIFISIVYFIGVRLFGWLRWKKEKFKLRDYTNE